MNWTLDTRIAPILLPGYAPTLAGRRAVKPLLEARDTILTEPTDRQGYPLDFEGFPEVNRCPASDGRGELCG